MKEILLSCPRCGEPVVVPATDEPFKGHTCPTTARRRFFAARIIARDPGSPDTP